MGYETAAQEIRPIEMKVLAGKASKEEGAQYLAWLESSVYEDQVALGHEDFMIRHKAFDYNAFTAHLVG